MSDRTDAPQTQPNPYESPKHPAKRWRFSVLTYAVIGMIGLSAVSAGAFITNRAITNNRKLPYSVNSLGGLTRRPVPRTAIEEYKTQARARDGAQAADEGISSAIAPRPAPDAAVE